MSSFYLKTILHGWLIEMRIFLSLPNSLLSNMVSEQDSYWPTLIPIRFIKIRSVFVFFWRWKIMIQIILHHQWAIQQTMIDPTHIFFIIQTALALSLFRNHWLEVTTCLGVCLWWLHYPWRISLDSLTEQFHNLKVIKNCSIHGYVIIILLLHGFWIWCPRRFRPVCYILNPLMKYGWI